MEFIRLQDIGNQIEEMSSMATEIVREHYDPIIGEEQNDYMIGIFQSPEAIKEQMSEGADYYFIRKDNANLGFMSFYLRGDVLYLSKFYLYSDCRGKGYSRKMLSFLIETARENRCRRIELNVNRNNPAVQAYEHLGFKRLREEKNHIGNGFVMDDYVYVMDV